MRNAKRPPLGARVSINVQSPFECAENPIWLTCVVTDLLSTQFSWTEATSGTPKTGIAFYAHYGDNWRYADENL